MRTIQQLIASAMVRYHSMHKENDRVMSLEFGTEEYDEAIESRKYYRKCLEETVSDLKALGIELDILI